MVYWEQEVRSVAMFVLRKKGGGKHGYVQSSVFDDKLWHSRRYHYHGS